MTDISDWRLRHGATVGITARSAAPLAPATRCSSHSDPRGQNPNVSTPCQASPGRQSCPPGTHWTLRQPSHRRIQNPVCHCLTQRPTSLTSPATVVHSRGSVRLRTAGRADSCADRWGLRTRPPVITLHSLSAEPSDDSMFRLRTATQAEQPTSSSTLRGSRQAGRGRPGTDKQLNGLYAFFLPIKIFFFFFKQNRLREHMLCFKANCTNIPSAPSGQHWQTRYRVGHRADPTAPSPTMMV